MLVDDFVITVTTGNKIWAGTDARVYIELYGRHGTRQVNSGELELYGKRGAFERKRLDWFITIFFYLQNILRDILKADH